MEERIITKKWIKAAAVRAVKTMAQTGVALIGTGSIGLMDLDWLNACSVMAMAGVLSIMTSLAGLPEVEGV